MIENSKVGYNIRFNAIKRVGESAIHNEQTDQAKVLNINGIMIDSPALPGMM